MENALLLDVGNTTLKVGVADENGLRASFVLPTRPDETADSLGLALAGLVGSAGLEAGELRAAGACSVVPSANPLVRKALDRHLGLKPVFFPEDAPLPINNRYERPAEVGADRLVTAFAARRFYEAELVVVVDFGTATTFDVLRGRDYLGGLICPGVVSSVRALATRTAKLPQIALEVDSGELHIGRSTSDSLNQGVVFGFAAMTDGLIARLAASLEAEALVVATGGLAGSIAEACERIDHVRPDLLLEGLHVALSMLSS
jgi:type III pantothenate kinase